MRFEFTRRAPGSLLPVLGAVAAVAAFCYVAGRVMPALQEFFRALYILLALAAIIYTLRWMRPRKADRRGADRRKHDDASDPV